VTHAASPTVSSSTGIEAVKFVVDGIGLILIVLSWWCVFEIAITTATFLATDPRPDPVKQLGTAAGYLIIGILFRWMAHSVVMRRRIGLIVSAVLSALIGCIPAASLATGTPTPMSTVVLYIVWFFAMAAFLTIAWIKKV
jgi:hypothetical protein